MERTFFTIVTRGLVKTKRKHRASCRSVSMHRTRRIPISYQRRPEFTRRPFETTTRFSFSQTSDAARSVHHSAGRKTFRPTPEYFLCRRCRCTCLRLMLPSSFLYLADQPKTASLKYGQIASRVILLPLVALISGFPKRLVHGSSTRETASEHGIPRCSPINSHLLLFCFCFLLSYLLLFAAATRIFFGFSVSSILKSALDETTEIGIASRLYNRNGEKDKYFLIYRTTCENARHFIAKSIYTSLHTSILYTRSLEDGINVKLVNI